MKAIELERLVDSPAPAASATRSRISDPAVDAEIRKLIAILRTRDTDPAYRSAPVFGGYGRISQDQDGTWEKTNRQQLDVLRAMVRDGVRFGGWFADNNRSAWKKKRKRPGFDAALDQLKNRQIDGLYCWHLDRLIRQPLDLEVLIDLADERVQIRAYASTYDIGNSDHRATLRMHVLIACKSSDDTSRRINRRNQARREKGLVELRDSFGHRVDPDSLTPAQRVQLGAERDAIRWGIESVVDGASWDEISREWNARGLRSFGDGTVNSFGKTSGGHPFHAHKVRAILISPRHAGLIVHRGEETRVAANVDPIVERKLWDAFQATLAARAGRRTRRVGSNLLVGLVQCGECGNRLSGTSGTGAPRKDGRVRRGYKCSTNSLCASVYIDADVLEEHIADVVCAFLDRPESARMVAAASARRNRAEERIADLRARQSRVTERYRKGELTDEQYEEHMDSFAESIAAAQTAVDEPLAPRGTDELIGTVESTRAVWDRTDGNPELRRRKLVRAAFPNGIKVKRAPVRRTETLATVHERWEPGTLRIEDMT